MNDKQPEQQPAPPPKEEVSPDTLMQDFRGKPLVTIVVFTLIVHVVVLAVFSYGYITEDLLGLGKTELTEEQRVDAAVADSTEALQDIANEYKIDLSVLTDRLGTGSGRDEPAPSPQTTPPTPEPVDEREQAFNESQEQLDAPQTPELGADPTIEDEGDLFSDPQAP